MREKGREEESALSRFPTALPVDLSLAHNRPSADIPELSREERSFLFFSLFPFVHLPFRSVPFRFVLRRVLSSSPLVATLFSHDARNSIQSSRRDLCRTLRSFVYRRFKPARLPRRLALNSALPPTDRNSNSCSPGGAKRRTGCALATDRSVHHSRVLVRARLLALVDCS